MAGVEAVQTEPSPHRGPYLCGQVELAADVVMATNVILLAAPGCRLVIAAGVCLGQDVMVQACRGDLVLEAGVNLGRGVLVVGQGRIGQGACIGAESTLLDPRLPRHQVVPPQSLLGDPSGAPLPRAVETKDADPLNQPEPEGLPIPSPDRALPAHPETALSGSNGAYVHGKTQVEQLLATLFPHRRPLEDLSPENRP